VPRFVISRRAKTKAHSAQEVEDLATQDGFAVLRSDEDAVLVDGDDAKAKPLGRKLRGWVVAPERDYAYPRRNPALDKAFK
jgi:hypothetical protein